MVILKFYMPNIQNPRYFDKFHDKYIFWFGFQ